MDADNNKCQEANNPVDNQETRELFFPDVLGINVTVTKYY